MLIVAINIGLLAAYTLYVRIAGGGTESIIYVAFFIAVHFMACLFMALIPAVRKGFLLSSAAVLLIGFSSCYLAYSIH